MKSPVLRCAILLAAVVPALVDAQEAPDLSRALVGELAPITPQMLTLEVLPEHPGAPAVVLRKRGTLRLAVDSESPRSTLDVEMRIKVLTEAGKGFGQLTLAYGQGLELVAFEGRTVGADGTAVAVLDDAVFRQDQVGRRIATHIAFPAIEIGVIIDYRYRLAWNAPIYPDPWYFDERIPTLESTFVYEQSASLQLTHHLRETGRGRYQVTTEAMPHHASGSRQGGVQGERQRGQRVEIRLEDLPAVADEPSGFPFADLAHCVWVVTEGVATDDGWVPIADRWRSQVAGYAAGYRSARRFDREARRMAKQLSLGERAKAEAVYRFVRETIRHVEGPLGVGEGVTVDQILRERQGTSTEIALVLAAMLEASGVHSRLVWAADWRDGLPRTDVVRVGWFSKTLVEADVEGRRLYLDASDRRLGMGHLAPVQEGTEAIVLAEPEPRRVTLPKTPPAGSTRHVELSLALDAEGRLRGRGSLSLRGHHAWFFLRRRDDHEAVVEGWRRWLMDRFSGFEIASPRVDEQVDAALVTVSWSMEQDPADVLGDEATIRPSLPWGPLEQRYTLSPAARKTPVRVSFADRDELVLDLSWSEGWRPEIVPTELVWPAEAAAGPVGLDPAERGRPGQAMAHIEIDASARRLRYERVVQIDDTVFPPGDAYRDLRNLYAAVEQHDAQPLVLLLDP